MAAANQSILVYVNGVRKTINSNTSQVLFQALGFTSDGSDHGVTITESGTNFNFNSKQLKGIAAGSTSGDAYEYAQAGTALGLKLSLAGGTMSGAIAMGGNKVTGLGAPTAGSADAATALYVDTAVAAAGTAAEWQNSVLTATILDPTDIVGSPTAGDRYLINGTGAGGWASKDNQIAQYVSGTKTLTGSWSYYVPTTGTFTSADDNNTNLYYYGGASWTTKAFESTTASGFLFKSGLDIQLKNLASGKIILGDGSGIAQAVTPTGDVTISNTGANLIASDAVTTVKILDSNVTAAKLATDSVTAIKIAADSVTTVKILDSNVTTAKLAATSVTAAKLGSDVAGSGLTGGNGSALAVDWSRSYTNDNAGSITAGQVAYLKANGNADLASKATANLPDFELLIVQDASIATTASGKLYVRRGAIAPGFTGLTIGKLVFVGATAGSTTQDVTAYVSGDHVYSLGRAVSATEVSYNPEHLYQVA